MKGQQEPLHPSQMGRDKGRRAQTWTGKEKCPSLLPLPIGNQPREVSLPGCKTGQGAQERKGDEEAGRVTQQKDKGTCGDKGVNMRVPTLICLHHTPSQVTQQLLLPDDNLPHKDMDSTTAC